MVNIMKKENFFVDLYFKQRTKDKELVFLMSEKNLSLRDLNWLINELVNNVESAQNSDELRRLLKELRSYDWRLDNKDLKPKSLVC